MKYAYALLLAFALCGCEQEATTNPAQAGNSFT